MDAQSMWKEKKMIIRKYSGSDLDEIARLFYDTVHSVNAADYTPAQLDAWATGSIDKLGWDRSFREHTSLVAVADGEIAGFADIDCAGYLDRLYVHKDYQRQGIATALCDRLEQSVSGDIVTHASITAKPFFERRGYEMIKEQQVERNGVLLENYVMIKRR